MDTTAHAIWGMGVDAINSVDPVDIILRTTNALSRWMGKGDQLARVVRASPLVPYSSVETSLHLAQASKASAYATASPATRTLFVPVERAGSMCDFDYDGFFSWLASPWTMILLALLFSLVLVLLSVFCLSGSASVASPAPAIRRGDGGDGGGLPPPPPPAPKDGAEQHPSPLDSHSDSTSTPPAPPTPPTPSENTQQNMQDHGTQTDLPPLTPAPTAEPGETAQPPQQALGFSEVVSVIDQPPVPIAEEPAQPPQQALGFSQVVSVIDQPPVPVAEDAAQPTQQALGLSEVVSLIDQPPVPIAEDAAQPTQQARSLSGVVSVNDQPPVEHVTPKTNADEIPQSPQQDQTELEAHKAILSIINDAAAALCRAGYDLRAKSKGQDLPNWSDNWGTRTEAGGPTIVEAHTNKLFQLLQQHLALLDAENARRVQDLANTVMSGIDLSQLWQQRGHRGAVRLKREYKKLQTKMETYMASWKDKVDQGKFWTDEEVEARLKAAEDIREEEEQDLRDLRTKLDLMKGERLSLAAKLENCQKAKDQAAERFKNEKAEAVGKVKKEQDEAKLKKAKEEAALQNRMVQAKEFKPIKDTPKDPKGRDTGPQQQGMNASIYATSQAQQQGYQQPQPRPPQQRGMNASIYATPQGQQQGYQQPQPRPPQQHPHAPRGRGQQGNGRWDPFKHLPPPRRH